MSAILVNPVGVALDAAMVPAYCLVVVVSGAVRDSSWSNSILIAATASNNQASDAVCSAAAAHAAILFG